MQSKMFSALLVGAALTAVSLPSVDAAKLDSYRAMMDTHRCAVLYENITPAERLHNRDKIQLSMWAKEDMADAPEYVSRAYRGVLVLNGSEKYEEKAYDDYAKSILTTGGKEFLLTRDLESKKPVYYGNRGKGKVAGTDADIERSLIYGESFGDADVTRLLSILLSPEKKPLGTPRFEAVGAGTLADGMSYEDYRAASRRCGSTSTVHASRALPPLPTALRATRCVHANASCGSTVLTLRPTRHI